jgi:hypothetical protein
LISANFFQSFFKLFFEVMKIKKKKQQLTAPIRNLAAGATQGSV